MRNLDSDGGGAPGLACWVYQLAEGGGGEIRSHARALERLRAWGLPVEPHWRPLAGVDGVLEYCREWAEKRRTLQFDTDGVVIKLDDLAAREMLGATSKFPRWAVAFKFPAEQATTRLLRIDVNVGRTGAVTPYAVLERVRLSGSTIEFATLHNEQEIARRDIRSGDLVLIEKGARSFRRSSSRSRASGPGDRTNRSRLSCLWPARRVARTWSGRKTRSCGAARMRPVRPG